MRPDRVLVVDAIGYLDHPVRFRRDVFRLMGLSRDHPVADPKALDRASDPPHDAEVAVSDPPGVVGRAGDALGALVIAAVGANLEGRDARLDPDLVGAQMAGVERLFLDAQVAGTVEDGDLHETVPLCGTGGRAAPPRTGVEPTAPRPG